MILANHLLHQQFNLSKFELLLINDNDSDFFIYLYLGACENFVCGNGGTCIIRDNQPTCRCVVGYKGGECEQSKPVFDNIVATAHAPTL